MDADSGAPKDELHHETLEWVRSLGLNYTKLSEIIKAGPCPKVKIFFTNDFCLHSTLNEFSFKRTAYCDSKSQSTFLVVGEKGHRRGNHSGEQEGHFQRSEDSEV